jgi:hypothetical protein
MLTLDPIAIAEHAEAIVHAALKPRKPSLSGH